MSIWNGLAALFGIGALTAPRTPTPLRTAARPALPGDDGLTDYIRKPAPGTQPAAYSTADVFSFLAEAEARYGIPRNLLREQAFQESRYKADAFNKGSGASGIMQIIPKFHPGVDVWNPASAIPYAASYLVEQKKRFGDWRKALAAYNWGPNNLKRVIAERGADWLAFVPKETRDYVTQITKRAGYA